MKRPAHVMTGRLFHWAYCDRCGLIAVSNEATRQALREGCDPKSVARRAAYGKGKEKRKNG